MRLHLLPHPGWLRSNPRFEVFGPTVILDAALVVDVFPVYQVPPEQFLHDEHVLENVSIGGLCLEVRGHTPQNRASPVFHRAAAPVTVAHANFRTALDARFRAPRLGRRTRIDPAGPSGEEPGHSL